MTRIVKPRCLTVEEGKQRKLTLIFSQLFVLMTVIGQIPAERKLIFDDIQLHLKYRTETVNEMMHPSRLSLPYLNSNTTNLAILNTQKKKTFSAASRSLALVSTVIKCQRPLTPRRFLSGRAGTSLRQRLHGRTN